MKLAGEEIDTKIAVLASLSGDRDTNDLARTALEDQQIANADKVARDCDCVGRMTAARLDDPNGLAHTGWTTLV
jgi:hypothetical protein